MPVGLTRGQTPCEHVLKHMDVLSDFVNEAPYRALFQIAISPDLAICPEKVKER